MIKWNVSDCVELSAIGSSVAVDVSLGRHSHTASRCVLCMRRPIAMFRFTRQRPTSTLQVMHHEILTARRLADVHTTLLASESRPDATLSWPRAVRAVPAGEAGHCQNLFFNPVPFKSVRSLSAFRRRYSASCSPTLSSRLFFPKRNLRRLQPISASTVSLQLHSAFFRGAMSRESVRVATSWRAWQRRKEARFSPAAQKTL